MPEDLETEAEKAEGYAGWDLDDALILVGVSIIGIVALAFWLYSKEMASLGVGLVGSFTAPVTAGFNGLAGLISGFFQWLTKKITSLAIMPMHDGIAFIAMWKVKEATLAVVWKIQAITVAGV